jgi:FMN phosphatase YigB (HAD superfamily)
MTSPNRHTVVCFDLGGVLVRLCQSWSDACLRAGLPERKAALLTSPEWRARRKPTGERYQRGEIQCDVYFAELSASTDGLYSAAELQLIHAAWTREHYAGADALVRSLNALPGVATACLSNTNHAHWARLASIDGRREYPAVLELRHRLASHLLGCAKPDARIFELAHAEFSRHEPVAAADIYFFDDLEENVSAALGAGWSAHQVDPTGDTIAEMRGVLRRAGLPL